MILGDYLYTNYLCKIVILIDGNAYSNSIPKGKFLKVKIGKEDVFFRYDDEENGFVLINQYGEKNIHYLIKSLMAAFIYKGMRDQGIEKKDIIINGEKIDINLQTLYLVMFLKLKMNIQDSYIDYSSVLKCQRNCIFENVCFIGISKYNIPIKIENFIENLLHNKLSNFASKYAIYFFNDDLYAATADFINNNLSIGKWGINTDGRIREIKRKLVKEIGYKKAEIVLNLARQVLNFYPLSKPNLNVPDYDGYLVNKNGYVYPSDKFWNTFLEKNMEREIERTYSKMNGKKTYRKKWVMEWD